MKMRTFALTITAILMLALALAISRVSSPLNEQSTTFHPDSGYHFDALAAGPLNSDELFICLMFSGGGTRAAALSYGIMEELRDTHITVNQQEKRLLDEVDCISSVSGGSFTAAYYGLFREQLFEDYRSRFLERNVQGALLTQLSNPVNWFRLSSPYFSRIDLAAQWYDQDIFATATFADLQKNQRPFVILNATNLGSSRRFEFTQDYFDALGSRLESYPVARAVAASSAFPYLLSPISLKNYPAAADYTPPWWFQGALSPEDWTTRRYDAARNLSVYLDQENRYIHLMDGGLSDNIGARSVLDAFERGFIRTRINDGSIRQLVLIVVNARTQSDDQLSPSRKPPGFFSVAEKTSTVAMDNYTYDSVSALRSTLYARVQAQRDQAACTELLAATCGQPSDLVPLAGNDLDPYVIEINFEALGSTSGEEAHYYLNLPTSFKLSEEQVAKLIAIGPELLRASPQYQCLLKVLDAEAAGKPRPADCPPGAGIYP